MREGRRKGLAAVTRTLVGMTMWRWEAWRRPRVLRVRVMTMTTHLRKTKPPQPLRRERVVVVVVLLQRVVMVVVAAAGTVG